MPTLSVDAQKRGRAGQGPLANQIVVPSSGVLSASALTQSRSPFEQATIVLDASGGIGVRLKKESLRS